MKSKEDLEKIKKIAEQTDNEEMKKAIEKRVEQAKSGKIIRK